MSDANNLDNSECFNKRPTASCYKGSNEAESFCQTGDPGRGPLTEPAGKVSGGYSEQKKENLETWKLCEGRTT